MSAATQTATASQTVGPFFTIGLNTAANGRMADRFPDVQRLRLLIRVTDGDDLPVDDALVELWQRGPADITQSADTPPSEALFGRMSTNHDGTCEFETVWPGRIEDGRGGLQAAHINVCLFARGLLRHLHTRIYFEGDPAIDHDAALALVPEDRRASLIASPDETRRSLWRFRVRLQGAGETVFFDV
ncbi:MAG TPA: protocatechuate 3,4-dioxygenase subunit alpha [Vicinamibacterales bacterium]|jgi:protocatechuate 3,4-dioxygenase alpha subunit|nr:protocatechuate 3,4-dioxygenase subunit alpha [Vicinamibacterales bacterium]